LITSASAPTRFLQPDRRYVSLAFYSPIIPEGEFGDLRL
jgi:hypothetical protein